MAYRAILLSDSELGCLQRAREPPDVRTVVSLKPILRIVTGLIGSLFVYTNNTSSSGELIIIGSRRTSGTAHVICIR